jgi:RNA polymerase sigma-70 factor (ECF subfamily)
MTNLRHTAVQSKEKLRKLADEDLMQLVAANGPDAFEVVLERHADAAFSLAYRMCGKRSVAEDVTQESFLALWRSGGRYDHPRGSVRTWILSIVHNRAIDALRRSGAHERWRASDDGIEDRLEAPDRTDIQALDMAASAEIHVVLGKLPVEQRRVIELAFFDGLTHTEIASMLNAPVGTVKGRMRLGLQKLRSHLEDRQAIGA